MEQMLMPLTRNIAYAREFEAWLERAKEIDLQAKAIAAKIKDQRTYQEAVDWCAAQKSFVEEVKGGWLGKVFKLRKERAAQADAVMKMITKPHDDGIELIVKKRMAAFLREQEIERLKKEQSAAVKQVKQETKVREITAKKLVSQGQHKQAEKLLKKPIELPTPVIPGIKASGSSARKIWHVEATDKREYLEFVLENAKKRPELLASIEINEKWFTDQANALDGNISYPGIVCGPDFNISINTARGTK